LPLASFTEGGQHDRQRGRRHESGSAALRAAQHDQQRRIRADRDEERADGERHHAGHQHPAPPEQVGRTTPEQQEPAEGQHVRGDHPADRGVAEVQLHLDDGQRDVDDGDVSQATFIAWLPNCGFAKVQQPAPRGAAGAW
jgi:hypothetical protein